MVWNPCIGCGYCCMKAMCAVGVAEFGQHGLCPGLIPGEGDFRFRCSLAEKHREALAIDEGCQFALNSLRWKYYEQKHMRKKMN